MKKLELGSGKFPHQGYTHIDIDPKHRPDIAGDFRTMVFSEVDEIRSHHLLEHFSRQEGIEVLKQWHSWLKKGGKLIVETPDFEAICHHFTDQPKRLWGTREMLVMSAYGSQEADWAYHKDGWWEDKFKEVLPELGFEITLVKHTHSRYHKNNTWYRLPNILVEAVKK